MFYEIPRRARSCTACQSPFAPGATYYSLLTDSFVRRDCCPGCFYKNQGQIYWKAQIPEKLKIPAKHSERALELLREIFREQKEMAYILALYLQRQKVIIRRHEGEEAILFEVAETEEMLQIAKVNPDKLDAAELQSEIAKRLHETAA